MTPVRNGVQYLDKYFENVEKFADALVFLDDGSTDNTYDIIKEHPLTKHIIRNPKRDPTKGWNASKNIFKMHEYIKSNMKDYDWILSIPIDETVHPTHRMKDLMEIDYKDDFFIGFHLYASSSDEHGYLPIKGNIKNPTHPRQHFRMWKNKSHYTISTHIPIHSTEVPDGIDVCFSSGCMLIHHGSSTYERRVERYNKYTLEIDPDGKYQSSYDNIHPDNEKYYLPSIKF